MNRLRLPVIIFAIIATILLTIRLYPRTPLSHLFASSQAVYDSSQTLLRLTMSQDEKYRLWLSLNEIPKDFVDAILLKEDAYFFYHPGINLVSLLNAVISTFLTHTQRVGASTITMQLARLVFHIKSNHYEGKLKQIYYALWLEACYSKQDILEAYLNLIPLGRNIEGIGAASLVYFGKPAHLLELSDFLTLAVIPQSPQKRFLGHTLDNQFFIARNQLLKKWQRTYHRHLNLKLDKDTLPIARDIEDLPFFAPHLVQMVLAQFPHQHQIITTLDLNKQKLVERISQHYIDRQSIIGVNNAAAMLLNYKTMQVEAYMGATDFFNHKIQGQVDGVLAKRSPGSTLKPFVYGLALEQGLIHPHTLLKDSPRSFGSFNPENFENNFLGPLHAQDALNLSRNIPAVFLLSSLKKSSFYELLKKSGVSHLQPESHYGLAIILGGIELSMFELVKLYAAIANEGILNNIHTEVDPKTNTNKEQHEPKNSLKNPRILNQEASLIVKNMLEKNVRPVIGQSLGYIKNTMPVAFKTGTSFGFRDAWTIGIFGPYVLAIWIGNFDATPNAAFVGRDRAAPLFFQIIDALVSEQQIKYDKPIDLTAQKNIKSIEVCALSGQLPNSHCQARTHTLYIPGVSPIEVCQIHREIMINPNTQERSCVPFNNHDIPQVSEFWPSDLIKIFTQAGILRKTPPSFESRCQNQDTSIGQRPQITAPVRGVTYQTKNTAHRMLSLSAIAESDVKLLYWFMDAGYIGQSSPQKPLFWKIETGTHEIRVVDDQGRSDGFKFKAE